VGDVPVSLAGTAAGVFKMSSMVGGAVGVALLTAFGRGFSEDEWSGAARAGGLSQDDLDAAHRALVDSGSFRDAIAELPAEARERITDAAVAAFSSGTADAMVATGVIGLAATVVVFFLWPRYTGGPVDGT
jgi:hypothetical protein